MSSSRTIGGLRWLAVRAVLAFLRKLPTPLRLISATSAARRVSKSSARPARNKSTCPKSLSGTSSGITKLSKHEALTFRPRFVGSVGVIGMANVCGIWATKEMEQTMSRYKDHRERLYPELLAIHNRLEFPRIEIDGRLPPDDTVHAANQASLELRRSVSWL
jgi:hypothetical protein